MHSQQNNTLKTVDVLGSSMAYRDEGRPGGPTMLLLHGNPTSSFIWRDIIPHVAPVARAIAPDLIGFGQSGKPDIAYRFVDHVRYLDAFIAALGLGDLYLLAQDWGSALAFHFAARFPERVRGLAFMEFIRPTPRWDDFLQSAGRRAMFQQFRTPGVGEQLLLEENAFIERVLPGAVRRKLTEAEMAAYRAPFPTPASRKPLHRFPNELPIAGEPADVYALCERDQAALLASRYPKLLFSAEPGALISPAFAEEIAAKLVDCRHVKLGPGVHNLQEDHPDRIGREVAAWIREIEGRASLVA